MLPTHDRKLDAVEYLGGGGHLAFVLPLIPGGGVGDLQHPEGRPPDMAGSAVKKWFVYNIYFECLA